MDVRDVANSVDDPSAVRYLPDYAKDSLIGITAHDSLVYVSDFPASIAITAWITGFLIVAAVVVNRRDV